MDKSTLRKWNDRFLGTGFLLLIGVCAYLQQKHPPAMPMRLAWISLAVGVLSYGNTIRIRLGYVKDFQRFFDARPPYEPAEREGLAPVVERKIRDLAAENRLARMSIDEARIVETKKSYRRAMYLANYYGFEVLHNPEI